MVYKAMLGLDMKEPAPLSPVSQEPESACCVSASCVCWRGADHTQTGVQPAKAAKPARRGKPFVRI